MYDKGGKSMRSKVFLFAAVFSLISILNASAEERTIGGEVTLTGQYLDIKGDKAKFNEYRDIHTGITGDLDFQYEKGNYHIDFYGKDVGRKDQSYDLSGGKWGSFKYDFRFDQLPHNFTTNAKTFYTGFGGANLTYATHPPNTNFTTWNSFDYSVERTNYSGGLKLDFLKPFFFDVSVSKETRKGIYPVGVAGTTPGGISIELPSPIDYDTDNLKLAAGYIKGPLHLSLSYVYTQFQNDNSNLNFRNPATANTAATTDAFTQAPNNNYYKLAFQGAVKLPWNSKFNADLGTAQSTSHVNLLNSYVADVTAATSNIGVQGRRGVALNDYVYDGKVDTQNVNLVLTSNPFYFLDGKVFYKYYNRKNKSDEITTTDPSTTPTTFSTDLFGYKNQKTGAELGFRLPASFYLSGGYTYGNIKREAREDIPKNQDDIYNLELRWSGLDFMVAKVGYEWWKRKAEFEAPTVTGPTDAANVETYIRRYDAATRDRDTFKVSLDFFPIENLSFNVGYKYKFTNYKDTILGLQDDKRDEFNFDADYLIQKRVRLFGYFDFEYVKLNQFQRQLPGGTSAFNPALPPTATAFNWTLSQVERNYAYGIGADFFILPKKLTLRFQHNNYQTNGYADYSYLINTPLAGGRTNDNIDISGWDTYRLTNYLVKAIYELNKSLAFTVGWAYEKYIYDDAQYNGYQYVPATTGTSGAYLTGAYSNPNYRANIFFINAGYKF
jgi:MtrB/PioB family decaheme-associated outer membrane protein